jgi:hypothetical protein
VRRWLAGITGVFAVGAIASCLVDIPDVVDGSADVAVPMCEGGCGAPVGFSPVLFALDRATSCPPSTTTLDLIADPTIGSACACDCTITEPPACARFTVYVDDGGSCNASAVTVTTSVSCWVNLVPNRPHWSFVGSQTSEGGCASEPASDAGGVVGTPSRACVDTTCTGNCQPTTGFQSCFFAVGDRQCPFGLTAHHVGQPSVSCGACSACSVKADCLGTVSFFSDYSCQNSLGVTQPLNTCDPEVSNAGSLFYDPDGGNVCTPGTSDGGVSLSQELTVCCP